MNTRWTTFAIAAGLVTVTAACSVTTSPAPAPQPARSGSAPAATAAVDPAQAERLKRIMIPLLANMNHPLPPSQVRVGIMGDPHINAANAGGGEFYVTTGLLQKANDDELRAVLAHEIAHADLGHVAKLERVGAGVNIGMVLLDQIIPGASALAPLAGKLITNAYTRNEEYAADAHGVQILDRAGYNGKQMMAGTLTWIKQTEGDSGGFFATHPATGDRIQRVERLKERS